MSEASATADPNGGIDELAFLDDPRVQAAAREAAAEIPDLTPAQLERIRAVIARHLRVTEGGAA